ncbi:uncharacterized protein RJT21DRAFT_51626 [Scheffersomyces amazonensis]|uniref:uncharacterized protein n=1 Tax=Scheffersomyces amazonensis TaxID=1078765 RepID=UPI00315C766B
MKQVEFHIPEDHWVAVEGLKGVYNKILNEDKKIGRVSLLQRYDAGAFTNDIANHSYFEEVYLIEGSLHDKSLNETFVKGSYAYRHPGMIHGPYKSTEGCIMLVIAYTPQEK